ncbi:MAG TPA: helix-turn-helix domain-containing GNAT family N-acetyltransferase [Gemmatimonadaceae bacterium]|jgi:DNA-binding MarR family transcriptional regulator/N-acetylglutamate synthase-like GNAT family acetyltransferase|nr:helix-turn-helix domain-containing GNAT family N-acetyltransferase [Gemmatimonadaceae bacterium]
MRDRDVATVRRFNRFYTKQIGILDEGLLRSPFSLAEVRVLYEIANGTDVTAAALAEELRLDPGYLSRILRRFQERGLVRRETSAADGRRSHLTLAEKGRRTFAGLDARQDEDVAALLARLSAGDRRRLVDAMHAIEDVLGASTRDTTEPYLLRQHQSGDMGWIAHRHGVLYSEEYGYDERFEALVAKIAGEFIEHLDPARERCWIAERRGEIVGSVFLVKQSATVAKLRLLYVEPSARGLGIGARLVDECIRFARRARYRKITLWTQSELLAARRIYEKAGFEVVGKERHRSFSRDDLVSETWELKL